MELEMVMPQMGESIAEATILKWHKKVGEEVEKDETILEISTDKVDSEIPAPGTGVLKQIIAEEGQTVPVKTTIAIIETDLSAIGASPIATPSPEPVSTDSQAQASQEDIPSKVGDRFYSPLVRSIASQNNVSLEELGQLSGSGADGRVTKVDVLKYIAQRSGGAPAAASQAPVASSQPVAPPPPAPAAPAPASVVPMAPSPDYGADGVKVEKMDNMRKIIAEHMVRSKATSPHVYTVAEVDMTNVAKWRKAKQPDFLGREGFKLSFMPFFLEAISKALVRHPYINSSVNGDEILLKRDINVGCAVALGTTGLVVPVIRSADQLSLVGLARSLSDLASRARSKKLSPDDIQGGTFTVTNIGSFGNIVGFPVINQPQVAILALGAIKKKPVVVNDMIAVRDMCYLTLSYDHRIIDGALGGAFLQYIVKYLEEWDMDQELF